MAPATLTLERCRFGARKQGFSKRSDDKETRQGNCRHATSCHAAGHGGRAMAMAHAFFTDVAALARNVLGRSKIFDIRTLDVDQQADCLVLRGNVDSFYHKQ